MIQVKNMSFRYSKKPFISNMNFEVHKGEIFGFLGPSGAGKSTLQKILIGMLPTYQGAVTVNGIECKKPFSIEDVLFSVGLSNDADKRVSEYSKGMKVLQK